MPRHYAETADRSGGTAQLARVAVRHRDNPIAVGVPMGVDANVGHRRVGQVQRDAYVVGVREVEIDFGEADVAFDERVDGFVHRFLEREMYEQLFTLVQRVVLELFEPRQLGGGQDPARNGRAFQIMRRGPRFEVEADVLQGAATWGHRGHREGALVRHRAGHGAREQRRAAGCAQNGGVAGTRDLAQRRHRRPDGGASRHERGATRARQSARQCGLERMQQPVLHLLVEQLVPRGMVGHVGDGGPCKNG